MKRSEPWKRVGNCTVSPGRIVCPMRGHIPLAGRGYRAIPGFTMQFGTFNVIRITRLRIDEAL